MGFARVLHRLFTRDVDATPVETRLAKMIHTQGMELAQLREDFEALKVSHRTWMGRVSAWKRFGLAEEAPATPANPSDPRDPSLTKAQVKAALAAAGRLRPTQEH